MHTFLPIIEQPHVFITRACHCATHPACAPTRWRTRTRMYADINSVDKSILKYIYIYTHTHLTSTWKTIYMIYMYISLSLSILIYIYIYISRSLSLFFILYSTLQVYVYIYIYVLFISEKATSCTLVVGVPSERTQCFVAILYHDLQLYRFEKTRLPLCLPSRTHGIACGQRGYRRSMGNVWRQVWSR